MTDEKGTTKTAKTPHQVRGRLWQDNHSGLRRHKLMTKELGERIPTLYRQRERRRLRRRARPGQTFQPLHRLALVHHRVGGLDRRVLRPGRGVRDGAGVLRPHRAVGGDRVRQGPAVERDLYWKPTTLGEIREQSRGRMAA